jgi:hypothetical protein
VTEPARITRAVDPMVEHHRSKSGSFGVIRNDDLAILVRCRNGLRTCFVNRSKEKKEKDENFIHCHCHFTISDFDSMTKTRRSLHIWSLFK